MINDYELNVHDNVIDPIKAHWDVYDKTSREAAKQEENERKKIDDEQKIIKKKELEQILQDYSGNERIKNAMNYLNSTPFKDLDDGLKNASNTLNKLAEQDPSLANLVSFANKVAQEYVDYAKQPALLVRSNKQVEQKRFLKKEMINVTAFTVDKSHIKTYEEAAANNDQEKVNIDNEAKLQALHLLSTRLEEIVN
jgi:hypothetical protein